MNRVTKRLYIEPENNVPDKNIIKEIGLQILKDPQRQKAEVGEETYFCSHIMKNWYMIMGVQRHCLFVIDLGGIR